MMRVRVDLREEERYAIVQCSCFILSCAGLVLYFFTKCGLLAGLLAVDEFLEIQLEAVLLLARAANEVTAGKFDLSDAFHHSATLGGLYLLAQHWRGLAWLAVHMQILHFPMVCWYLGGRKRCVLRDLRAPKNRGRAGVHWLWDAVVLVGFRSLWLFAAAYRFTILFVTAVTKWRRFFVVSHEEPFDHGGERSLHGLELRQAIAAACFCVVFSTLDVWWTRAFFSGGTGGVPFPALLQVGLSQAAGLVAASRVACFWPGVATTPI